MIFVSLHISWFFFQCKEEQKLCPKILTTTYLINNVVDDDEKGQKALMAQLCLSPHYLPLL